MKLIPLFLLVGMLAASGWADDYSADLVNYSYPEVKVRLHVGSGTYIRSIANDLGDMLGTGAYCKTLRRTSIGKWSIDSALKLDEL